MTGEALREVRLLLRGPYRFCNDAATALSGEECNESLNLALYLLGRQVLLNALLGSVDSATLDQ